MNCRRNEKRFKHFKSSMVQSNSNLRDTGAVREYETAGNFLIVIPLLPASCFLSRESKEALMSRLTLQRVQTFLLLLFFHEAVGLGWVTVASIRSNQPRDSFLIKFQTAYREWYTTAERHCPTNWNFTSVFQWLELSTIMRFYAKSEHGRKF